MNRWGSAAAVAFVFFFPMLAGAAGEDPLAKPYRRKEIFEARFGQAELQEFLRKAYRIAEDTKKSVVGQDRIAKAMQERVVRYLEGLGSRTKEPVALHMLGLPGIGKSAMLEVLEGIGIKVLRVDAQNFTGENATQSMWRFLASLEVALMERKETGAPLILLFDELDKVSEITPESRGALSSPGANGATAERTNPLIGVLNQILTDGRISNPTGGDEDLDLSNVLIVSAMNLSPTEIEAFSAEVLGAGKSFYDFTIDDFARFDAWLRLQPSAVPKILSHLFRSNTVSRLGPNALVAKPLLLEDYREIVRIGVERAVKVATTGRNASKKISVEFDGDFLGYLVDRAVYAPSGARDTVIKVDSLAQQLINFGVKLKGAGGQSLVQPRLIRLGRDGDRASITVTPRIRAGKETHDGEAFRISVSYDADVRAFDAPSALVTEPAQLKLGLPEGKSPGEKPVTLKELTAARFPTVQKELRGLAKRIDESLIGQAEYTKIIERDIVSYVGRLGPAVKNPPFRIIGGFPGIGKSELFNQAAKLSGLKIARLNMQGFTGDDAVTMQNFISELRHKIDEAKEGSKNGKYILLIEELDKVFERDPTSGAIISRPVMNFVKDLLNDGVVRYTSNSGSHERHHVLDVRDAYAGVTMNFTVDRFDFKADPRLTTVEDTLNAWKALSSHPAELKKLLDSMFLGDTVSRMLPFFLVMKPLAQEGYRMVIGAQAELVTQVRLRDPKTGRNKTKIDVRLTPAYRRYLEAETVIPALGARHTVQVVQQRIGVDLDRAIDGIPRSSKLARQPLVITLDFKPGKSTVVATAVAADAPDGAQATEILRRKVALTFPSLEARGKLSEQRLLIAVHEFGHAITGIRLGRRIEYATAVSMENGVGGFVRFADESQTAGSLVAAIYSALGSRAMERVFLSANPLSKESVLDINYGAASDIQSATQSLWKALHEFGFDPDGGTIERKGYDSGVGKGGSYADFSRISAKEVEQLGLILRDMETYLVARMLRDHPREWYVDKIKAFAKRGAMNEGELYELLGYPHPGDLTDGHSVATKVRLGYGEVSALEETFKGVIEAPSAALKKARKAKRGLDRKTAQEEMADALGLFRKLLRERLHGGEESCLKLLEPRA